MRKFTIWVCILMIIGHALLESGALYQIYKNYQVIKIHPFLKANYDFYDASGNPVGLSLYHWIQMNAVDFLFCTTFFILAKVSHKYSFKLFLVCCVFFLYHLIDYFMLWYDYKTSILFYWFLNGAILVACFMLFIPEKKQGKLKSFE